MMEVSMRRSCREKVEILPVPREYIFSLITFTVNNLDNFQTLLCTGCIQGLNTSCIDTL